MCKKVLVLSTRDSGGAGESAFRITKGLCNLGIEAKMIVRYKSKPDAFVLQVPYVGTSLLKRGADKLKSIFNRPGREPELNDDYCFFNLDETKVFTDPSLLLSQLPFKPDIILLGWVTEFITSSIALELKRATNAMVYWLMTDMAPITGGCHYAWNCKGYLKDCDDCPAIVSSKDKYLAKRNLATKKKAVAEGDIRIIAGSLWTYHQARQSSLFKDQNEIPIINGLIDFSIYNPSCRSVAKTVFNIDNNSKIIFTGATLTGERRKGIRHFVDALISLWDMLPGNLRDDICVLIAGNKSDQNEFVNQIPFKKYFIDFIKDERLLSLAYQAADVFVCSSVEDSGPMMVNEALACGTPVVGFELGFMIDMVVSGKNGFKVPVADSNAMAKSIRSVLTLSENEFQAFSANAIAQVKKKVSHEALAEAIKLL
jgi:glycosyltransferase involved in cell wall biosynthesis